MLTATGRTRHGAHTRRAVLLGAAAATAGCATLPSGTNDDVPIVDAHLHVFDATRPQGAAPSGSPSYNAYMAEKKVYLPPEFARMARPLGIVGGIIVEASTWLEDNLWYLEVAQDDPMILGVVGQLDPADPKFAEYVERFAKHPLYQGIRYSDYYSLEAGRVVLKPGVVEAMKRMAGLDLVLDSFSPTFDQLRADLLLADAVPDLRIVLDHQLRYDPTPEQLPAYQALVTDLAARPSIACKLTQTYHTAPDGKVERDYGVLAAEIEFLFDRFGEDRVIFGSDFPNNYNLASLADRVSIMRRFFAAKSRSQAEKFFWRNSARIYKWTRRDRRQPTAI